MAEYNYYSLTDIGKVRLTNEDNAYQKTNNFQDTLLMLLDGMGGQQKGDVASKLSIDFISKHFLNRTNKFKNKNDMKKWLYDVLKEANQYIYSIANSAPHSKGMGTTIVCVLISKDNYLYASLGDTRCYILKDKILKQISKDDTYPNFLLENGKITLEECQKHEKKNVLTNALGSYNTFNCNINFIEENFDSIFLCTDGLYNMVSLKEIEEILNKNDYDVKTKCVKLVNCANKHGGKDNIGVLLCEVRK